MGSKVFRSRNAVSRKGAAILEFAMCLPLFLTVICGAWSLYSVLRARQQVIMVAHAVMREAAGGVKDETALTAMAAAYGRAMGMSPAILVRVTLGPGGLGAGLLSRVPAGPLRSLFSKAEAGTRVKVSAVIPFSGVLGRAFPAGMPVETSFVLLTDPWKSPLARVNQFLRLPGGAT